METGDLIGKRIGILGFGIEGQAVASYLNAHGLGAYKIFDRNAEIQAPGEFASVLGDAARFFGGPGYLEHVAECDVLFRSPGIRMDLPELRAAADGGTIVTSQVKFFMQNCRAQVIGVTGTKGKGTTSSLIHGMLQASGKRSNLAGNFGTGVLPLLDGLEPEDYVVLELSSFQLQDLDRSPHVAVVLMVTSAHLDYHGTDEEYVSAKAGITKFQGGDDFAVVNVDFPSSAKIGALGRGQKRYVQTVAADQVGTAGQLDVYQPEKFLKIKDGIFAEQLNGGIYRVEHGTAARIAGTSDFALRGFHNVQNIAAALSVSDILGLDSDKSLRTAKAFVGLRHRLELVGEVSGVRFYNDSIGTTPDSALAAVRAFDEPVVAIMGGHDNGNLYSEMAAKLIKQKNLKAVVLIGEVANKIGEELAAHGLSDTVSVFRGATTMGEAVDRAVSLSKKGDVIVLAPAAQSFGMFKNYQDRGDQFRAAVERLAAAAGGQP